MSEHRTATGLLVSLDSLRDTNADPDDLIALAEALDIALRPAFAVSYLVHDGRDYLFVEELQSTVIMAGTVLTRPARV